MVAEVLQLPYKVDAAYPCLFDREALGDATQVMPQIGGLVRVFNEIPKLHDGRTCIGAVFA